MTKTVRRRPKLSRRRNSGGKPGVIYTNECWINQTVKVIPIGAYKTMMKELRSLRIFKIRIRRLLK